MDSTQQLPHSADVPEPVARVLAIAAAFGVESTVALSQFESFGNENWLVETSGGRRTVLRRYVHGGRGRLQFLIGLHGFLLDRAFPAPRIITTASGAPFQLDNEEVPWAAFTYIDGREYAFSIPDAVQAAQALARFHLSGIEFDGDVPALAHRPSLRDCWISVESDQQEFAAMFKAASVDAELTYLRAWWQQVLRQWPVERLDTLPRSLLHGDFHGRNLAYGGNKLVGVFDYDDVELGPPVHDLAFSLYRFGRESRFSLSIRPKVFHAFLAAYEELRPLSEQERQALPVMLAMTYPPNPRYYRYYRDHHGSDLERRLRREVRTMRALGAQINLLLPDQTL